MNDNQIMSFSEIVGKYRSEEFERADKISTVWKKVVSNVRSNRYESEDSETRMPIGERLANNTRVVDLKNGVLLVEADHSGWIQYLRTYQKFIIKGLQMNVPELKIQTLAFRMRGSNISLNDSYEDQLKKTQKEMEVKISNQEKEAEKFFNKNTDNSEIDKRFDTTLPPEILAKFDSIRESMLTNSKK